jgi:hypothetical protein
VSEDDHRYLEGIEHREEGGTPAIIESIRAGLVFQLKEAVGWKRIQTREHELIQRAIDAWSDSPNVQVLGSKDAWRLSIVSFVVRREGRFLHHNFVVALLNDLFGIQSRGGCSCAGPYGHRLLGIETAESLEFQQEIMRGCEGIKPGWVRVNFNYFITDEVFDFIVAAVKLVADHGWRLLPAYSFDPLSGLWTHREGASKAALRLDDVRYRDGQLSYRTRRLREPEWALEEYLETARELLLAASFATEPTPPEMTADFDRLRWFELPREAFDALVRDRKV